MTIRILKKRNPSPWIRPSEGLPSDETEQVLVAMNRDHGREYELVFWGDGRFVDQNFNPIPMWEVDRWMPIPPLPGKT